MFADFKLRRKILSTYYIAVVFSYFIFRVIAPFITTWVRESARFLTQNTTFNFIESGRFWLFFLFFCFIITFLIRRFVVEPLGFFIEEEGDDTWWENVIMAILILGLYIYLLNQLFTFPMPEWTPEWLARLLGGYKNTFLAFSSQTEEQLSWPILPWIWYIGPIVFMYFRTKVIIKK
ncbi:MAG: hypothetical protein WCK98_01500 [bacterium]